MNALDNLQENISKELFGNAKEEALKEGLCIQCGEPALQNCYSAAGRREYLISGLCEKCFDSITLHWERDPS